METKSRTHFIFIHGGPGFVDYLEGFFKDFSGPEVVAHFYTQIQKKDLLIDELLNQLDQIVAAQHGRIILVGHSWGGVLACQYAVKNENKIDGLVLMNTGLDFTDWKDEFHKELDLHKLKGSEPEKIFLDPSEYKLGIRFLEDVWNGFSDESLESLNRLYIKNFDLKDEVKSIKIPILNIFGEVDHRFPKRVISKYADLNSLIENYEINNAGHFPFLLESNKKMICQKLLNKFAGDI